MTTPHSLDEGLKQELQAMQEKGTYKTFHALNSPMHTEVAMDGRGTVLVLSSNNYLGLSNHPDVVTAGIEGLQKYGAGTASVRFICGTFSIHEKLEQQIAHLHRQDAALTYVSCWTANTGLIPAVAGAEDALVSDALNHASLIDGCRASKATRKVYKHSDMHDLEARLKEVKDARRIFIVTDGVFSMEGDIAKLPQILEIAERYNASVILDDSHGVGVMGKHGRGTAEHFEVEDKVHIVTGTLGKALGGAAGGYVAGSKPLIEYLKQVSRPQLFSNALPTTVAASALRAIDIIQRDNSRVERLHLLTAQMRDGLKKLGFKPLEGESAIIPIIVGETSFAIQMSQELLDEGIYITGFGYPVVPEGEARLRLQVCATLTDEQVHNALLTFEKVGKKMGLI